MHTGVKIDCIADTSYTDREVLERILDGREKPSNLSFTLLKDITENFSDGQEIGQGGFATVYKGVLPNWNVAVKRIKNNHSISETSFYREVDSLLNIEHKNVVRFLGFCASTYQTAIQIEGLKEHIYAEVRERLLCFEYISNGSLQKYITDELRGLEWSTRYEIIRGICEGLHHLHKEKQIYHMDLKPDNILLDNDMIPKITDFGLSRLDEKSKTMSEDRPGSLGYCAPEYLHQGKMSFKSDIYSLGVIIIELVTGEKEIPGVNNNILRRWRHRWKRSGKESPLVYQQVAKCIEVGLICQDRDPSKRPFIWDMIHDIRQMEGVNGTILDAPEHKFRQIHPYSEDDMLGIEPLDLHFRFQLNKYMSCSFQLTNETNSSIAFNVENTSPLPYCTQPHKGIMPPRSKCNVEIILQPQGKAPRDRCNEFIVWSTNVNDGLAIEDITTNMFIKEGDNVIDDVHLDVVFEADDTFPPSPQTIPPLLQSIDDAGWSIDSIDANPTEPLIITSRLFGYVQIWNYDTQELICSTKVSKEGVHDVKFIARKRWFVAVSPDHFVHVYEYGKNMQKITSLRAHDHPEGGDTRCSLDVHPTLPYVLSGCGTQIKLWDWNQGWNCIQTFEEHSGEVRDVTFIPEDTNSFASASDYRLKVWSFDSAKSKYILSGHSAGVLSMDFFTRDGHQYLITGSWDETAKIWDMQKKECIHTLEHMSTVLCVLSHPSLPVLVTGTRNGVVNVWSSTNFRLKTVLKLGNGEWVAGFACLMGSGSVAVAHQKGVSVIQIPDEEE